MKLPPPTLAFMIFLGALAAMPPLSIDMARLATACFARAKVSRRTDIPLVEF